MDKKIIPILEIRTLRVVWFAEWYEVGMTIGFRWYEFKVSYLISGVWLGLEINIFQN